MTVMRIMRFNLIFSLFYVLFWLWIGIHHLWNYKQSMMRFTVEICDGLQWKVWFCWVMMMADGFECIVGTEYGSQLNGHCVGTESRKGHQSFIYFNWIMPMLESKKNVAEQRTMNKTSFRVCFRSNKKKKTSLNWSIRSLTSIDNIIGF